jgi:hypothetical protein
MSLWMDVFSLLTQQHDSLHSHGTEMHCLGKNLQCRTVVAYAQSDVV